MPSTTQDLQFKEHNLPGSVTESRIQYRRHTQQGYKKIILNLPAIFLIRDLALCFGAPVLQKMAVSEFDFSSNTLHFHHSIFTFILEITLQLNLNKFTINQNNLYV